nr:DUF4350 domain-containing protein [Propionicimonas sp.]
MKRWFIAGGVLLALFAALVTASVLLPDSPDRLAGSITNARPQGVRALGQVLAANGVEVTQVTTLDEATAAATAGSSLAVYLSSDLSDAALDRLQDVPADLVIAYAGNGDQDSIETLTDGQVLADYWWADSAPRADCTDPDAVAAGTLTADSAGIFTDGDTVTTCFADDSGSALYADTRTDRHRVTVVAGSRWLRNDTILAEGNAALALRVFGRNAKLVWYLPGADALPQGESQSGELDPFTLLPPWARIAFAVLLVAGAAAALWRGRRFGALVPEQLPVEVPASEVSSGLARLYRQASARGHAAAGLRAATIHRIAARLGLPASASADLVVERLAQASGDLPERIRELCYGPAPASDSALVELATDLTDLERRLTTRE